MRKEIKSEDLKSLNHQQQVTFALFCAKQVVHLTKSKEVHHCVEVVELWLDNKATAEECRVAAGAIYVTYAARDAGAIYAAYAARDAIYATYAAHTTRAAAHATYAAHAARDATVATGTTYSKQEILQQQHNFLYELKNIDKIFEKEVLVGEG